MAGADGARQASCVCEKRGGATVRDRTRRNESPRRKPGDSGHEHHPTSHADPGRAQPPGVPGLPSGASCQTGVRPGGPGQHQRTEARQEKIARCDVFREHGSRGTPGANTTQRAMQIREEPNHPVSPDFRPGLPVKRAPGREHTRIGHAGLWPVSRSITPTSSFTAAMLLSSAARSSGSNLSSMIFSTPPLPSTTGTPTK